jgi:two-component system CheB/CheR fusion protein
MQSLNEELQTVNAELEERNRALSQANDDMQNLLNSIEVATVFLDDKLAIKRFTTQAKKVFSLIETDIGRPISDLTANLRYEGLVDDAREVMRSLVFKEREIQTKEGAWRLMRIMPYRTFENLIDGLVMTFIDVDRMKRAENDAQTARSYAETIVDSVTQALLVIDHELRVLSANRAFHELYRTSGKAVVGEMLPSLLEGTLAHPQVIERLQGVLDDQPWGEPFLLQHTFQRSGPKKLSLHARKMSAESGRPPLVLLTIDQMV